MLALMYALCVLAIVGYVRNVYVLIAHGPDWLTIVRVIGVLVPPFGAVMGFVGNFDRTQG